MKLGEIAHARTGDKGNLVNISLIAYREDDYPLLEQRVNVERVTELFASVITCPVERFCIRASALLILCCTDQRAKA